MTPNGNQLNYADYDHNQTVARYVTSPPPPKRIVSFGMWENSSIQPTWSEHTRSLNASTSAAPKSSMSGESATTTSLSRSQRCGLRSSGTGPKSRLGRKRAAASGNAGRHLDYLNGLSGFAPRYWHSAFVASPPTSAACFHVPCALRSSNSLRSIARQTVSCSSFNHRRA